MHNNMTISEKLSKYIVSTSYEDIPERIVVKIRQVLLDSICSMIGGSQTAEGRISAKVIGDLKGEPESILLGIYEEGPFPKCSLRQFDNGKRLRF